MQNESPVNHCRALPFNDALLARRTMHLPPTTILASAVALLALADFAYIGAQDKPAAKKALTFTIAADQLGTFRTYGLGYGEPIDEPSRLRILDNYAHEKDQSGDFPGYFPGERESHNWLALRCDGRAESSMARTLINQARTLGLRRLAYALKQDFPASDFEATRENPASPWRRPVHTEVSSSYRVLERQPPRAENTGNRLTLRWDAQAQTAHFVSFDDADGFGGLGEVPICGLSEVAFADKHTPAAVSMWATRRAEIIETIVKAWRKSVEPRKPASNSIVVTLGRGRSVNMFPGRALETALWVFALMALDAALQIVAQKILPGPIDFLPTETTYYRGDTIVQAKPSFATRRAQAKVENNERVVAALKWLKHHQDFDGFWSATRFRETDRTMSPKRAKKTANLEFVSPGDTNADLGSDANTDIGLTGLALLAFAGNGADHKQGDFREACRRAIVYLRRVQTNSGGFGSMDGNSFMLNTAYATAALAELYGMTGDAALKITVERAVEFIVAAQNPGMGWGSGVKGDESDTNITGWMIAALHAAKLADIKYDTQKVFGDTAKWLNAVTCEVDGVPKTGFRAPGSEGPRTKENLDYETNRCMDAINIYCRLAMGAQDWDQSIISALNAQSKAIGKAPPQWDHLKIDYTHWFWGSNAMYQMGGENWQKWQLAMERVLLTNQRGWRTEDKDSTAETLDEHGSWDAVDAWHHTGGRVYSTAMCCLILETPYRYARFSER